MDLREQMWSRHKAARGPLSWVRLNIQTRQLKETDIKQPEVGEFILSVPFIYSFQFCIVEKDNKFVSNPRVGG